MGDKSLADVLPPGELLPVLTAKANKSGAKVDRMLADVQAELTDRARQQAGAAQRAARRARLADAGVLKAPNK
jgi:hypothetical protein